MASYNKKQEDSTLLEMHHADYSLYVMSPLHGQMYDKALRLIGQDALRTRSWWSEGARVFVASGELGIGVQEIISDALFFENTDYQVEVEFHVNVSDAQLVRPIFLDDHEKVIRRDSFMHKRQLLSFVLNYGNEIGQSDIVVEYIVGEEKRQLQLHIDVLSTKLDYHQDLEVILRDIEKEYAMLSLSFLRKTYHTFKLDNNAEETPDLIWWNIFKGIQAEFCEAVSRVINAPHNRLRVEERYRRADQLRRVTPAIERELQEHRNEERHLYRIEEWVLNDDTPENRFVKFALQQITEKYNALRQRILHQQKNLPAAYEQELQDTSENLQRLCSAPFLRRIGRFTGLKGENLTLKQATGYSTIYRNWLLLQSTYDLHAGIQQLELKDIATLYEIWCFIKVKNLVHELLETRHQEIIENSASKAPLDWVRKLAQDKHSRVVLQQGDIRLAEVLYNSQFGIKEDKDVRSLTVEQRPDIVLRLTKDDVEKGLEMTYLFDAKYRINEHDNGSDTPPDDAINQMHRYRDAIYYADDWETKNLKREVLDGYILFPGKEPKEGEHIRYLQSIDEVNIGAFPLRPSKEGTKDRFLRNFLAEIIEKPHHDILLGSIPQRGLKYHPENPSPIVLVGYVRNKQWDIIQDKKFYYIRAVEKGKNTIQIDEKATKAKYIWLYDDKKTAFYEITETPKFYTPQEIQDKGFGATSSIMYIGYSITECELPKELEGIIPPTIEGYDKIPQFKTMRELMHILKK